MDREQARKNLALADEALSSLDVTFWLDCGTLLGAIRGGDFFSHDLDLDLSCWHPERHAEIRRAMEAQGFIFRSEWGVPDHGYEQKFRRRGINLDIFYFYEGTVRDGEPAVDPHLCWQGSWYHYPHLGYDQHLIVSEFDRAITSRFRYIDVFGSTLPVPYNPERMLEARYGPDWRTPVKQWDWARDPRCIRPETRPDA